ncbi:uncharacterized protein LOC128392871 [Panonychus citri]|uniref:uncharacterized protein LOC128392871 n=1 Tax=Panonychus citri TaxID=50023 RepID=UPI00230729EA|nr:uncharacterized protein LOC128392871 [Panonychus citri]
MEDDIFKIIQDASGPRTIERRTSLTSKILGNAKDWINQSIVVNRRYSESQSEDGYARSFSSSQGDHFEGLGDLIFRKRSQSITGENPVKAEANNSNKFHLNCDI